MARTCTICTHVSLADINAALIAGQLPLRTIADHWSVSKTALLRHQAEHLPEHLAQAQDAREVAQADDLLAQVRSLQAKALGILATAEQQGDLRTALLAIREARGSLELLAKLLGELDERPQINVLVDPEWLSLRTVLLEVLRPYGEARAAVATALLKLEAPHEHAG
jgi:hypothetical protein